MGLLGSPSGIIKLSFGVGLMNKGILNKIMFYLQLCQKLSETFEMEQLWTVKEFLLETES